MCYHSDISAVKLMPIRLTVCFTAADRHIVVPLEHLKGEMAVSTLPTGIRLPLSSMEDIEATESVLRDQTCLSGMVLCSFFKHKIILNSQKKDFLSSRKNIFIYFLFLFLDKILVRCRWHGHGIKYQACFGPCLQNSSCATVVLAGLWPEKAIQRIENIQSSHRCVI